MRTSKTTQLRLSKQAKDKQKKNVKNEDNDTKTKDKAIIERKDSNKSCKSEEEPSVSRSNTFTKSDSAEEGSVSNNVITKEQLIKIQEQLQENEQKNTVQPHLVPSKEDYFFDKCFFNKF